MGISDNPSPVPDPLSSSEQTKILSADDKWTDRYAWEIVKSNWAYAESYRINAHDWRYRNADELYLAWAGQRYWDGTRVPRSSLGIYVVFEQVMSLLPKILSPVASQDSYHFTVEGAPDEENGLIAQAWRDLVLKQLGETKFRRQLRLALHSMEQYGNGVLEVGFEDYEDEYINFEPKGPSQMMTLRHPTMGPMQLPSPVPSGDFKREVKREVKSRPYVKYVSVKDLYVDPNLESPCLQDAEYVIKRTYMRAADVKALGKLKDFKVPDDAYLTQLSHSKSTANQDVTKLSAELFRYNMWNPAQDYTSDPSQKRIAVVEYTGKSRKVWWLQGGEGTESVIYNQRNRYNLINFFSVDYASVLDRWHALAVSDVSEGEQRLQQSIINGRVDELALTLYRPVTKRRGVTIPAYQLKVRPGLVRETENPKDDLVHDEVADITQSAYVEVNASQVRVERITGQSSTLGSGTAAPGGNSANRTAAGINAQSGAVQDRIRLLVETIEDELIEPIVNAIIKFDKKFLDVKQAANWLKLDPRFQQIDPQKIMNARVSVDCKASAKMAGRMQFMQFFPTVIQTYLNPQFLQAMQSGNQMTIDPSAIEQSLWDGMSYTPRNPWFKKMTQDQIKAMQQPPPEVAAQTQMAQDKNESDAAIAQMRTKSDLLKVLLKEIFGGHQAYAQMDDDLLMHGKEMALAAKQGNNGNGDED